VASAQARLPPASFLNRGAAAAWGAPGAFGLVANRRSWWPFSGMLLSRKYREVLAPYPHSRAWASWLFLAHWRQINGLVVFVFFLIW